ncbi:MULE domain-containing protein [Aphis craccivora]|uniref:MULE domain-containing protein n=1 Tax=Aphis craccivora TaxID=307492 RepID=A0A6G0ZAE0_APHCR|nr:MULE domain-containing protein [Aphis craccivora]
MNVISIVFTNFKKMMLNVGVAPSKHPLPENILTRQKISKNLKRKAIDDMFVRPSKILHSELKNDDIENITSGDVLLINEIYIMLDIQSEDFLLVNNNETNLLGFSTVRNLQALCSLNTIFVDVEECRKNDMQFNPVRMYVDFEKAIHTASNVVWPSIQVKGCRFHLGQKISNFLKFFFGLPFLNPQDVENCFTEDIMAIQPQDARVLESTDYILDSYIKNDADFPPEIWLEYLSSTLRKTNNCESFHRKLNSSFNSSHPNIYNFIDVLKNIQIDTYIALRSQRSRNRITIEKEGYIKKKNGRIRN